MGAGSGAGAGGGRRPSLARPPSPARWTAGPQGPWAVEGAGGGTWAQTARKALTGTDRPRGAGASPSQWRPVRLGTWPPGTGPAAGGAFTPLHQGGDGCERLQEAWGHLAAELGPEPRPAGGSALRSAHAWPAHQAGGAGPAPPQLQGPGGCPLARAPLPPCILGSRPAAHGDSARLLLSLLACCLFSLFLFQRVTSPRCCGRGLLCPGWPWGPGLALGLWS